MGLVLLFLSGYKYLFQCRISFLLILSFVFSLLGKLLQQTFNRLIDNNLVRNRNIMGGK